MILVGQGRDVRPVPRKTPHGGEGSRLDASGPRGPVSRACCFECLKII